MSLQLRAGRVRDATRRLAVRLVGLAIAVLIIGLELPVWVRLAIALPILIWIAGDTVVRLVLGRDTVLEPIATDSDRVDEVSPVTPMGEDSEHDALWAIPMVLFVGVVIVLATSLGLSTFGFGLGTRAVVGTLAAIGALLSLMVWWTERRRDGGPARHGFWASVTMRRAAAVVVAALAMAGAITFAKSLYDVTPDTHYALTRFIDTKLLTQPLQAKPGERVEIGWQVQSFGWRPPESDMPVEITIGDGAPIAPETAQETASADAADTARDISAQIRAPRSPGTYLVRIVTEMPNGKDLELTTHLKVHR